MHRSSSSLIRSSAIERNFEERCASLYSQIYFPRCSYFLPRFLYFLFFRLSLRSFGYSNIFKIFRQIYSLFPPFSISFSIFFLHVPFFPALAHYRKLEVTRERGILMYTVELRCSRKKGEREGGREGELQSAPNRWRIQCCFLPRREARLLERRRRLTFDPLLLPLSLLAPPLFGHSLHKPIVFFLFARKSASFVFTSFIGKKKY